MNGKTGIIYIVTNRENGKQYVGQSKDFKRRLSTHPAPSRHSFFAKVIREYGLDNFSFITVNCPLDQLDYWERFFIDQLGTMWPGGYNHTNGGKRGFIRSEDYRRRISEWMQGKHPSLQTRNKLSQAKIGKPHFISDETKKKMSLAAMGKPKSEDTKRKMSAAMKLRCGEKAPHFGKHPSAETRQKMSEAKRGEKNYLWGKHHTLETIAKMREAKKRA